MQKGAFNMKKYYPVFITMLYISILVLLRLPFWQPIDEAITLFFISHRLPHLTILFDYFTHLADTLAIITLTGSLLLIFSIKKQYQWATFLLVSTAVSATLNKILKELIMRARPTFSPLHLETSYSFPSGHSCAIMTLCGFLIYYTHKRKMAVWIKTLIIIGLSSIILLIGISRLYLGVHWFTDIIAGFSTALFSLYFSFYFLHYLKKGKQD